MKKYLNNIEEIISGFFIIITVAMVMMNVILRYGFNRGIYWSEEVATISFVWSVFIGASACYRKKLHIGIDMIKNLFPIKVQEWINLIINVLLLIINGYITYLSIVFIRASLVKKTAVLGISSAYVSASLLVGFGLMTFHTLRFIIKDIKILTKGSEEINTLNTSDL